MATNVYESSEAIRADFINKAPQYRLSAEPTSGETQRLVRAIVANCKGFNCLITGTTIGGMNWGFILETVAAWRLRHLVNQQIDPTNDALVAAAIIPPYPHCPNPGEFQPLEAWSITKLQIENIIHTRAVANYTFKSRLTRALFDELKLAIPNGIIADHLDEDNNFLPTLSVSDVLGFLVDTYNQLTPDEISKIHVTFNMPFDTAGTHGDHFKRLQNCQAKMVPSNEPILDTTMMRVCLGHFENVPYMVTNSTRWKRKAKDPLTPPETWTSFKTWWTTAFLAHSSEARSLNLGGIANSAVTENEVEVKVRDAGTRLADAMAREFELRDRRADVMQEALVAMSANSNATHSGPPSVITAQTSGDAILRAENESLKRQLAEKKAPRTKFHNRSDSKTSWDRTVTAKRYYQNNNYCWSHGHDIHPTHTGVSCKNKKEGHLPEATIHDRRGGSNHFSHLVGEPASTS